MKARINSKIRKTLPPCHAPDGIYAVPEFLQRLNDKKLKVHEVRVKNILPGIPINKAVSVKISS